MVITRVAKKLTNEQFYAVIQIMLEYERDYLARSAQGRLYDYIADQYEGEDGISNCQRSGLETISDTDILDFFIKARGHEVQSTMYGSINSAPIHATSVGTVPVVEAHPLSSIDAHTNSNSTSSSFNSSYSDIRSRDVHHHHHHHHYNGRQRRGGGSYDMLLGYLMGRDSSAPRGRSEPSSKKADEWCKDFLGRLAAFIIFMLTVGSLVYLAGQIKDIGERLVHHEGRAYALFSAACLGASAFASFFASTSFVPLILLATAASNPVAWAIFGVIAGTIILTATAHALVTQLIEPMLQDTFEHHFGGASFVPSDLGRVQLTQPEEDKLTKKGIDPMKVRGAIALIREKMGSEPIPNKWGILSLMNAMSSCMGGEVDLTVARGKNQQHLEIIRQLRSGKLNKVELDGHDISLRQGRDLMYATGSRVEASAPPLPGYDDPAVQKRMP